MYVFDDFFFFYATASDEVLKRNRESIEDFAYLTGNLESYQNQESHTQISDLANLDA